jgi:hypothetical protein
MITASIRCSHISAGIADILAALSLVEAFGGPCSAEENDMIRVISRIKNVVAKVDGVEMERWRDNGDIKDKKMW